MCLLNENCLSTALYEVHLSRYLSRSTNNPLLAYLEPLQEVGGVHFVMVVMTLSFRSAITCE